MIMFHPSAQGIIILLLGAPERLKLPLARTFDREE
jgi:hypothetical protein